MKKNIPFDPKAFSHWTSIPVRFRDLDPLNHVNNAIFNTYFEESRIQYFRSIPSLLEDLRKDRSFVLVHIDIDYTQTVSYPSTLTIGARIVSTGNTSIHLQQGCFDKATHKLKAVCESVLVWYDVSGQKPARLPDIPSGHLTKLTDSDS